MVAAAFLIVLIWVLLFVFLICDDGNSLPNNIAVTNTITIGFIDDD